MKGAAPALIVLPLVAAVVLVGGLGGAVIAALLGFFLLAFALLLFRGVNQERPVSNIGRPRNLRAEADAQFLGYTFVFALFVRVALALLMRQFGINEVVAPDEFTFHGNAAYFAEWLSGERLGPFTSRWAGSTQVGYFAWVGFIYYLFGPYQLTPVLVNCVIGALCAYPAYTVAAGVAGRQAGRTSALLVAFFPSLILWSTLLIRDSLVLLLILWAAVFAQAILRRFRLMPLVFLLVCLGAMATLRTYLFFLLAGGTLIGFASTVFRRPGRAFGASILAAVGLFVLVRGVGIGEDMLPQASLERLVMQREWNALQGNSTISLDGYDLSTPTGALTYLPVGLTYFLFSPFPWQVDGRQMLAMPDVLVWYAAVPLFVRGAWYGLFRRRRPSLMPLLAAAQIACLYGLVAGNVGILFRHRAQFLVLALPFVAVGWARLKLKRARQERAWRAAAGKARGTRQQPRRGLTPAGV